MSTKDNRSFSARRAIFVLTLGLCLALLSASAASAATWTTETTPNAPEAEDSAIYDVSCEPTGFNFCYTVGKKTVKGTASVYGQWRVSAWWNNLAHPVPAGATASELQAVHCPTYIACVAAGSYTTASGTFSLVETFTSSTGWLIQTTPNPAGATETRLKGVGCTEFGACTAVGHSNASGKWALAMRGSSGSWSLQTVPKPASSISSELNGAECVSSTSCIAVGGYNTGASTYWAMAAHWNGTEWTLQAVPKPAESTRSTLLDISCTSSTACTAVGGFWQAGTQRTFAVRWNGTSWTHQASPNPAESVNSVFQNVSCASGSACVAVGDWRDAKELWRPMAEAWNGTTWSLESAQNPTGSTFGVLEGVSCRNLNTCLAVGWWTDASGNDTTLGQWRE